MGVIYHFLKLQLESKLHAGEQQSRILSARILDESLNVANVVGKSDHDAIGRRPPGQDFRDGAEIAFVVRVTGDPGQQRRAIQRTLRVVRTRLYRWSSR